MCPEGLNIVCTQIYANVEVISQNLNTSKSFIYILTFKATFLETSNHNGSKSNASHNICPNMGLLLL